MEGEYDGRQSKDEVNINQKKGDIQHEKEKYRKGIDDDWQPTIGWHNHLPETRKDDYQILKFEREAKQHLGTICSAAEDAAHHCIVEDAEAQLWSYVHRTSDGLSEFCIADE